MQVTPVRRFVDRHQLQVIFRIGWVQFELVCLGTANWVTLTVHVQHPIFPIIRTPLGFT